MLSVESVFLSPANPNEMRWSLGSPCASSNPILFGSPELTPKKRIFSGFVANRKVHTNIILQLKKPFFFSVIFLVDKKQLYWKAQKMAHQGTHDVHKIPNKREREGGGEFPLNLNPINQWNQIRTSIYHL